MLVMVAAQWGLKISILRGFTFTGIQDRGRLGEGPMRASRVGVYYLKETLSFQD